MSILKASLEETQRNKLPRDFSQFKTFISNTRDNQLQRDGLQLPTIPGRIFPSSTPTSTVLITDPIGKAVSPSQRVPAWEFTVRAEHMCLNFPEEIAIYWRELRKWRWEDAVPLGMGGAIGRSLSSKKPHSPLFSVEMGKTEFHFQGRLLLWSLIWHHILTQHPMYRQSERELAEKHSGSLGTPWLTVSETASKDPCLLVLWNALLPFGVAGCTWPTSIKETIATVMACLFWGWGDKNTVTSVLLALCHSLLEFSLQGSSCHMYELPCGNQGQEPRAPALKSPDLKTSRSVQQSHMWTWVDPLNQAWGASSPQLTPWSQPITDRFRDGGLQLNCTQTSDPGNRGNICLKLQNVRVMGATDN